jgi:hypothetical protein
MAKQQELPGDIEISIKLTGNLSAFNYIRDALAERPYREVKLLVAALEASIQEGIAKATSKTADQIFGEGAQ